MKKMKKVLISGSLALSCIVGSSIGMMNHPVEAASIVSNVKTIKGYTLSYSVPKNVEVILYASQVVFKRNGVVVGGIEFLAYDGKQTATSLLPNHGTIVDSRKVTGLVLPCERFLVQSEDSRDYHSILLDAKKKRAFDFHANSILMTDKEIKDIRASIKVLR